MADLSNRVRNMHYDFKQKLNKIDSQQYRNLKVPEIDWKLNEALYIFIKRIAEPKTNPTTGVEKNTRSIDDLRMIITDNLNINVTAFKTNVVAALLPDNYLHHISSRSLCTKGNCVIEIPNHIQKHGNNFVDSLFDKSSFEWRQVNTLFVGSSLHLYNDGTFTISKLLLDYIRKPLYLHTAIDAVGGKYNLPNGIELTGFQNCELPDIEKEIVDLAVLITIGDLTSDYQAKYSKIQITDN
jgi:hypothetical protein